MTAKNTICLWFNKDAEEAAKFYAATFPDSSVGNIFRAHLVISRVGRRAMCSR
jgi:predicted 3-demethylubiquinone-9 3-methyltransferase (glyoxalase superfamily)